MTNFKQALARVLTVTLSLMILAPMSANAAESESVSDTLSRHETSTVSSHTLAAVMDSTDTFVANETLIFDFADSFGFDNTIGNWTSGKFSFNDGAARTILTPGTAPTCTAGADNVSITVDYTLDKLTVTACPSYSNATGGTAGATLTLTVDTAAPSLITNPTAGLHEIGVSGTYNGGNTAEIEVPIISDDQVVVSATVDTYTSFAVNTTDGSDNNINLGELKHTAVTNSNDATRTDETGATLPTDNIRLAIDSNANGGVVLAVKSANGGLKSTFADADYTLTSATEALSANQKTVSDTAGYGLQAQTVSPNAGALTPLSPYNGASNSVGAVSSSFASMYNSSDDPVVMSINGQTTVGTTPTYANVYVIAVPAKDTPAADDYNDTLTFRATSTF